jgi:hypothetical protein
VLAANFGMIRALGFFIGQISPNGGVFESLEGLLSNLGVEISRFL